MLPDHTIRIGSYAAADLEQWMITLEFAGTATAKAMRAAAATEPIWVGGEPLTGNRLAVMRARLLRPTDDYRNGWGDWYEKQGRSAPRARDLIPGLMPDRAVVMLGGQSKAGKTKVVADWTATVDAKASRCEGRLFLGRFGPVADLPEISRGIVVINAETRADAFEEEMRSAGARLEPEDLPVLGRPGSFTEGDGPNIEVIHLEAETGGPGAFDLTDPGKFDYWVWRLTYCYWCDSTDDNPPFAIAVDNTTAILKAEGKGEADYAHWFAQFRRLLTVADIPVGLGVWHNYLTTARPIGGPEALAGPDSNWRYMADDPMNPTSTRRFSTQPRTGGGETIAPTRVLIGLDGRLLADGAPQAVTDPPAPSEPTSESEHDPEPTAIAQVAMRMVAYVEAHPGIDGARLTREVDAGGWKALALEGRTKAVTEGRIHARPCTSGCSICAKPYYRRQHYWPGPSPQGGGDPVSPATDLAAPEAGEEAWTEEDVLTVDLTVLGHDSTP